MATADKNTITASFSIEGVSTAFYVLDLWGQEGISTLFSFELQLTAQDAGVSLSGALGKTAVLTITGPGGQRHVHGMISEIQQRETRREGDWNNTYYRVNLAPKARHLTYRTDCRIFQKKDFKEIVSGLLKEASIEHTFHSSGKQPQKREYCVQYQETDWDFISRLLQEEGYFYYFEHSADQHVLHIGNDYQHHKAIPGSQTVPYHDPDSRTADGEHITRFFYRQRLQSGRVSLTDYNYEKPSLNLLSRAEIDKASAPEVYSYPGLHSTSEAGKQAAQIALEALQAEQQEGEGQSVCPRLVAGCMFELDKFDRTRWNKRKYVLTRVVHNAESLDSGESQETGQASVSYFNSFFCIPRQLPFRPRVETPKPRIPGVQTAVVMGRGQEIDTDRYGRIHVKFHWDRRTDTNRVLTCWIRVAQTWAGQTWGAQFIPRAGQEVIVEFIDGDPDRPLVTGSVYNALHPPPYLPAEPTKSTVKSHSTPEGEGFNELRFEDKKGAEEFFTHAERDQLQVVKRHLTTTVGKHKSSTIKGKQDDVVKGGDATLTVTGGNRVVDVTAGEYKCTASSGVKIIAKGGGVLVKGNPFVAAVGTSKAAVYAPAVKIEGKGGSVKVKGKPNVDIEGDSEVNAKAPTVTIDGKNVNIKGSKVKIEDGEITITGGDVTISGKGGVNIKSDGLVDVDGNTILLNC